MWAKIDDQILDNPKIAALTPEAKLTYFAAIVHCKQQMTDGLIATPLTGDAR